MSEPTLRRVAWILTGLEAVLITLVIAITLLNGSFSKEGGFISIAIVMMIGYGGIGGYLAAPTAPQPDRMAHASRLGRVRARGPVRRVGDLYVYVTNPGALPALGFMAWLTNWIFLVFVLPIPFILTLFPTGRIRRSGGDGSCSPSARRSGSGCWRRSCSRATWTRVAASRSRTPPASLPEARADVMLAIAGFVGLGTGIALATAPFFRFRRADGEQRQQLRWLAYVTGLPAWR